MREWVFLVFAEVSGFDELSKFRGVSLEELSGVWCDVMAPRKFIEVLLDESVCELGVDQKSCKQLLVREVLLESLLHVLKVCDVTHCIRERFELLSARKFLVYHKFEGFFCELVHHSDSILSVFKLFHGELADLWLEDLSL